MGVNTFVTSDDSHDTSRNSKKRLVVILLLVVIIVGVVAALWGTPAGRELLAKLGIPVIQNDTKQNKDAESQPTNMLNYEASQMIISGDTDGAMNLYKKEIDRTTNNEDKAVLLLEISNLLWNNGETSDSIKQQVLDYAKQADQLYPTSQSAAFLRQIYLKTGNSTEADKYLRLRDERSTGDTDSGRGR